MFNLFKNSKPFNFSESFIKPKRTSTRYQWRQGSIAFGPQHPAAHGILKLQLQLNGEILRWVDPQFGFLHRGTEKLMEGRTLLQSIPYFDRFDYVANLFQEHAYCLAVEALSKQLNVLTATVQLFRTLFDEISRILNHLLTLSASALDLGVMGPIFWAFEEREALMEICERASGARMHTALYRPFGFDTTAISSALFRDITAFITRCSRSLSGAFMGLLYNRAMKTRLSMVGQISTMRVKSYGITGLLARSSGWAQDLRLRTVGDYGLYRSIAFRSFLGKRGDNFDRFLIRVKEVSESFRIMGQLIDILGWGHNIENRLISKSFNVSLNIHKSGVIWGLAPTLSRLSLIKVVLNTSSSMTISSIGQGSLGIVDLENWSTRGKFVSMESLISHFRLSAEGYGTKRGFSYAAVESPKGEVGVTCISSGSVKPYRVKMRTPVSHNMHLIPTIAQGVTFADLVANFCSLDIVMGEIDR